jgi:DNA-binding transcriptional regulator YdaS (Cro superfamily)
MAETHISITEQLTRFIDAVELLGGQRAAARAIGVSDRTIRFLVAGQKPLHTGYTRDIATALLDHASRCSALERQINPLYTANRTAAQRNEKPDGRRFDQQRTGEITGIWVDEAELLGPRAVDLAHGLGVSRIAIDGSIERIEVDEFFQTPTSPEAGE